MQIMWVSRNKHFARTAPVSRTGEVVDLLQALVIVAVPFTE